jgi:mannose-6-phosphate isomerase-like protein (cupin superfamily)
MPQFHHYKLPDFSTLLSGRFPPDDVGFQSERLWIWYHNSDTGWVEPIPHMHQASDECFIVLQGGLLVEVEGEQYSIGPREACISLN